jgi:hypothetical protein
VKIVGQVAPTPCKSLISQKTVVVKAFFQPTGRVNPILNQNGVINSIQIEPVANSVPDLGALGPDTVANHFEALLVALYPRKQSIIRQAIDQERPEVIMQMCSMIRDRPRYLSLWRYFKLYSYRGSVTQWLAAAEAQMDNSGSTKSSGHGMVFYYISQVQNNTYHKKSGARFHLHTSWSTSSPNSRIKSRPTRL